MTNDSILTEALKRSQAALSEHDSKLLLAKYDVPTVPEKLAGSASEAVAAASEIGYPVVLKAC
ncbi:MAG TPA: acetate--CoA ligase family protein, partial [Candidatus Anoxymicrobiaceae bacterium]